MITVKCKACGEEKKHYAKGYCTKCYHNQWRKQHPESERQKNGYLFWRTGNYLSGKGNKGISSHNSGGKPKLDQWGNDYTKRKLEKILESRKTAAQKSLAGVLQTFTQKTQKALILNGKHLATREKQLMDKMK